MRRERREASAEPDQARRATGAADEVTYQRVSGDLGPIGLLGSPPPRVVVETRAAEAVVWIENPVWGWPVLTRAFLNRESPKVARYAKSLALMIKAAALKEQDRKARRDGARWQERVNRAWDRNGGDK